MVKPNGYLTGQLIYDSVLRMDSTICDRKVDDDICGGVVTPVKIDGRFYFHKDVIINIPKKFITCKCQKCGLEYLSDEMEVALDKVLDEELVKKEASGWNIINHAELIDEARMRFKEKSL